MQSKIIMQISSLLTPERVLIILYTVGIVGVSIPISNFMLLTPVNLLITFILALYADKQKSVILYIALSVCYLFGFFLEMAGVNSGLIFGDYHYGKTLGPKFFGTPLIIGINWAMLVYGASSLANRWLIKANTFVKSIFGASLMVSLDVLIEPVAINYDFWSWSAEPLNWLIVAPFSNYAAWWIAAFILNYFFHKFVPGIQNNVIELLLFLQAIFFAWIIFFVI